MYVYREFLRPASGPDGDTAIRYIRYSIPGDTVIAGIAYRLMVEEDLAFYNSDQGLVKNKIAFAVMEHGDSVLVKQLRLRANTAGRLPMKAAAREFDSVHFEDEITSLIAPLRPGQGWTLRAPGQPFGRASTRKTYIGLDSVMVEGKRVPSFVFELQVQGQEYIRYVEWYDKGKKLMSTSAYSANAGNVDSIRSEEEYLGSRGFTFVDTQLVLRSANQ